MYLGMMKDGHLLLTSHSPNLHFLQLSCGWWDNEIQQQVCGHLTGVKWYQYHLLQLFQQMPRDLKAWFSPTPETQIIKDHSITTTGAGSSKTGHDETRHALPTPFLWLFNNSAILVNWGYFSKPKQTPHSKRLVLTIRVLTFPLLIHKLT